MKPTYEELERRNDTQAETITRKNRELAQAMRRIADLILRIEAQQKIIDSKQPATALERAEALFNGGKDETV